MQERAVQTSIQERYHEDSDTIILSLAVLFSDVIRMQMCDKCRTKNFAIFLNLKNSTHYGFNIITHADNSRGSKPFSGVYDFVCLSVFRMIKPNWLKLNSSNSAQV